MRSILAIVGLALTFSGCAKAIEEKAEDAVLEAMTTGQWYVVEFRENGNDITTSFSPYSFQFYRDGSISALSTAPAVNGIWFGDPNARTITTNFRSATEPISKMNAVWAIKDNSWDYVKAETTVDNNFRFLYLKKK